MKVILSWHVPQDVLLVSTKPALPVLRISLLLARPENVSILVRMVNSGMWPQDSVLIAVFLVKHARRQKTVALHATQILT